MKICTIVGARPQFVKCAVVSRALKEAAPHITEILIHTGQHYDDKMSGIFFREMSIPEPQFNLGIGGTSHGEMTGLQIIELEKILIDRAPDYVMVYGDTNTTLAGCIAAVKLQIPVIHIEAGLRSKNMAMPEEINRIITDRVSEILFCPTKTSSENLISEGIESYKIEVVGDVMYDAVKYYASKSRPPDIEVLLDNPFILSTLHRAENTSDLRRLQNVLSGLSRAEHDVILPIHPRTKKIIYQNDVKIGDNIKMIEPVSYFEMLWLEQNCIAVATDSGGVQKEAFFHKKPCITLRDETEWTELVDLGVNILTGADVGAIVKALNEISCVDKVLFDKDLYGSGSSGLAIAKRIAN